MKINLQKIAKTLSEDFGFIVKNDTIYFTVASDIQKFRDSIKDLIYPEIPENHIVEIKEIGYIVTLLIPFLQAEMHRKLGMQLKKLDEEDIKSLASPEVEIETISEDVLEEKATAEVDKT